MKFKFSITACAFAFMFNSYCDVEAPSIDEAALLDLDDEQADAASEAPRLDLLEAPDEPLKATPLTGVVNHDSYITVPSGKVGNWSLLVSPHTMGYVEAGSEKDNALIKLECYSSVINDYTWKVTARYKYRFWSTQEGEWRAGKANYILVPR